MTDYKAPEKKPNHPGFLRSMTLGGENGWPTRVWDWDRGSTANGSYIGTDTESHFTKGRASGHGLYYLQLSMISLHCANSTLCLHSTTAQTHPLNSLCPTYFRTWIYMRPTNCSICLISRNLITIIFQPAISTEWERERQAESRAWKEREKAAVF